MPNSSILVTGSTGFIGTAVTKSLQATGASVVGLSRSQISSRDHLACDITNITVQQLEKFDVIIHLAALAHVPNSRSSGIRDEYLRVNTEATVNLASKAATAGVKRFVFLSSINVNGDKTSLGKPFRPSDEASPRDITGISKHKAEMGLSELASQTDMEVVVIRSPLVYGPGVKGNFAHLIKIVSKGLPLPLGSIRNHRSLIALDNLVDLITQCTTHPAAANELFLAGDGHDLSTTELLQGLAKAMGKSTKLIPVSESMLRLAGVLLGQRALTQRLLSSLQVDISKARHLLGWEPPITVEEGLRRCFVPRVE